MAKTQEELNQLKEEYETLSNKLSELTEDEIKIVSGGYEIFDKYRINQSRPNPATVDHEVGLSASPQTLSISGSGYRPGEREQKPINPRLVLTKND